MVEVWEIRASSVGATYLWYAQKIGNQQGMDESQVIFFFFFFGMMKKK